MRIRIQLLFKVTGIRESATTGPQTLQGSILGADPDLELFTVMRIQIQRSGSPTLIYIPARN
jgi:hypothetical protein